MGGLNSTLASPTTTISITPPAAFAPSAAAFPFPIPLPLPPSAPAPAFPLPTTLSITIPRTLPSATTLGTTTISSTPLATLLLSTTIYPAPDPEDFAAEIISYTLVSPLAFSAAGFGMTFGITKGGGVWGPVLTLDGGRVWAEGESGSPVFTTTRRDGEEELERVGKWVVVRTGTSMSSEGVGTSEGFRAGISSTGISIASSSQTSIPSSTPTSKSDISSPPIPISSTPPTTTGKDGEEELERVGKMGVVRTSVSGAGVGTSEGFRAGVSSAAISIASSISSSTPTSISSNAQTSKSAISNPPIAPPSTPAHTIQPADAKPTDYMTATKTLILFPTATNHIASSSSLPKNHSEIPGILIGALMGVPMIAFVVWWLAYYRYTEGYRVRKARREAEKARNEGMGDVEGGEGEVEKGEGGG